MHATLQFPSDVFVEASTNFGLPNWGPWKLIPSWPKVHVTAHCERGDVRLYNFVQPTFYHHLRVKIRNPDGTETSRIERVYVGKNGLGVQSWTTYRFQLEAFVNKLKGRETHTWVSSDFSIANMRAVDMVYEKSLLGLRPLSTFHPQSYIR